MRSGGFCRTLKSVMKRFFKSTVVCCLLIFVASFFMGCESEQTVSKTFFAMNTVMNVSFSGTNEQLGRVEKMANDLEEKFSVTKTTSVVYGMNERGEKTNDEETISLLRACKDLSDKTDGAFDITVYPIVKAWGFTTGEYDVPSEEKLLSLLPKVDSSFIRIENGEAFLENGAQIDLGGIAKGYCSDKIADYLRAEGVKRCVINLGGNVYALGEKKKGTPWKVGVASPDGNGLIGVIDASDQAVVTSGLYERNFVRDGVTYGHIVDPFTGKTVSGDLLSVTVVGKSGTECDAFSTALFVKGAREAAQTASKLHLSVLLLTTDGTICISQSLKNVFTPSAGYEKNKIIVIE